GATPVDQDAVVDAERGRVGDPVLLQDLGNAFVLELHHVDLNAALSQSALVELELDDLDHVERGEAAADDEAAGLGDLEARARVARLVLVVEPLDERVLVGEPFADEVVDAREPEAAVAPGAVREEEGREAPVLGEVE